MENNTGSNIITNSLDTNAEYISQKGIHDQPPIITSVFRSIFVETPKDFFSSIRDFFRRYVNLFKDGYKYLRRPSLKIDPFNSKDYKENCQHTFEFLLIVIAIIIFSIKMDWISGQEKLKEVYNNDISQAFIQLFIFICLAICYFIMIVISVLIGRLFRIIFKIPVTRQESDILFSYLNNTLFLVTGSVALLLRCFISFDMINDNEPFQWGIIIFFMIVFLILIFPWSKRFTILNNVNVSKRLGFQIIVTVCITAILGCINAAVIFFILGV